MYVNIGSTKIYLNLCKVYKTKAQAQNSAKNYRKKGRFARVRKLSSGYGVYST